VAIDNYKLIENYFKVNTNWDDVTNLLYKNAKGSQSRPNVLWFKIKNRRLFDDLPDLKEFFEKINKDFDSAYLEKCKFYDDWENGRCNCRGIWHIDGPVISLDSETMSAHKDIRDSAYLQILGNSYWKLDGKETITLKPGDLLFVSKEITHEVWGQGPRMGILLMALNSIKNQGI
jgi:hypothetical protein